LHELWPSDLQLAYLRRASHDRSFKARRARDNRSYPRRRTLRRAARNQLARPRAPVTDEELALLVTLAILAALFALIVIRLP